jgi:hypothetical protein
MKKSVLGGLALLALGAAASGCAVASGGNGGVTGFLYSGYKMGGAVGTGPGTKMGQACASSILGVVGTGDASISAAKRAGSISTVAYVDHDVTGILGIYATTCTVVYGD